MAWARFGDTAATDPRLVSSIVHGDDRTVNELFGFLARCATQAAAHETDYMLDVGTVMLMGGARALELLDIAKRVGLIVGEKVVDGVSYWELIDDSDFIHMRTAADLRADRQRKSDNRNPTVTAAVRLRDGDQCRWCGVVTWWGTNDRKSSRVGTYDHLKPVTRTTANATAESMVVACLSCNSARKEGDDWNRPLLPVPSPPHYSRASAEFIMNHLGITVTAEDKRTGHGPVGGLRPGSQPGSAAQGGPAASRGTREDHLHDDAVGHDEVCSGPATGRSTRAGSDAPAGGDPPEGSAPRDGGAAGEGDRSGFTGSGRVGSDGDGSGLLGAGRAVPGGAGSARGRRRSKRRSRRGGRGR